MATVGQQLTAPEEGWKRYDNTDSNISYIGSGWFSNPGGDSWKNTDQCTNVIGDMIKFSFTGSRIRYISWIFNNRTDAAAITIDGIRYNFSEYDASGVMKPQVLVFELTGLSDTNKHNVEVMTQKPGYFDLDAIDIDETGELLPYNPDEKVDQALLRVTMIDSSEREYRLSIKEVEGFVNWYKRTLGTGDSCYELSGIVDNSKEYLAFEKIISFKVIPLNN